MVLIKSRISIILWEKLRNPRRFKRLSDLKRDCERWTAPWFMAGVQFRNPAIFFKIHFLYQAEMQKQDISSKQLSELNIRI